MRELRNNTSLRKTTKNRRVALIIMTIIVILLAVVGVLFAINKKEAGKNSGDNAKPETSTDRTSENGLPGSDYATGSTENSNPKDPQSDSDSPPSSEPGTPSIEISSFSQNSSTVDIKTTLSNIGGVGKCVFTFSKDGAKSVVREVSSNGKTCSASAKSTEFSKLDIWTLNIAFYNGSKKVVDTTLNVTIN